ncbi:hypothetical protein [Nocardia salmonicida]|uniref:hypothetical protein n=1 Tax=Nocardia salmonicida TaxID=53431 RepID=UPI0037B1AA17
MSAPVVYRHRVLGIEVEAMQSTGESTLDLLAWITPDQYRLTDDGCGAIWLRNGERVWLWDWAVRDPELGHFWRVPPTPFSQFYVPAPAPAPALEGANQ